jgi:hypothetical protein
LRWRRSRLQNGSEYACTFVFIRELFGCRPPFADGDPE